MDVLIAEEQLSRTKQDADFQNDVSAAGVVKFRLPEYYCNSDIYNTVLDEVEGAVENLQKRNDGVPDVKVKD